MAVTVATSIERSITQAKQAVTLTAVFTNSGVSDVKVKGVWRLSPDNNQAMIIDDYLACNGINIPASDSVTINWRVLVEGVPTAPDPLPLTFVYAFQIGSSVVTPPTNPQLLVYPIDYSGAQNLNALDGYTAPGALNFADNLQSGLLAFFLGGKSWQSRL